MRFVRPLHGYELYGSSLVVYRCSTVLFRNATVYAVNLAYVSLIMTTCHQNLFSICRQNILQ